MKRKKDRSGRVALIASGIVTVLVGACVFSLYSMAGGAAGLAATVKNAENDGTTTGKLLTIADEDLQEAIIAEETAAEQTPAAEAVSSDSTPAVKADETAAAAEEPAAKAPEKEAAADSAPAPQEAAPAEESPAEDAPAEVLSEAAAEDVQPDESWFAAADKYADDGGLYEVPDYGYISTDEYYVDGSWYTGDADYSAAYDYTDYSAWGYDPFAGYYDAAAYTDPYAGYYDTTAYEDPYAGYYDASAGLYDVTAYTDPYAGYYDAAAYADPYAGYYDTTAYEDPYAGYYDASAGLYDVTAYTDPYEGLYIDPFTGFYKDNTGYFVDPATGHHFDAVGNYVDPNAVAYTDTAAYADPYAGYNDTAAYTDVNAGYDAAANTDPYAGYYLDPNTGFYMDDTGYYVDPATGYHFDAAGNYVDLNAAAYTDPAADTGYDDLYGYTEPEAYTYNTLGQEIVDYAKGYVGVTPYVWAGRSLTSGTDCSGFVNLIYDQFGIYCSPASMAYDGSSFGYRVSAEEAQPGDIAVYGGGAHVGIYAGDGKVVHCSSPENGTVYWDMDYRGDFSWFLRVTE